MSLEYQQQLEEQRRRDQIAQQQREEQLRQQQKTPVEQAKITQTTVNIQTQKLGEVKTQYDAAIAEQKAIVDEAFKIRDTQFKYSDPNYIPTWMKGAYDNLQRLQSERSRLDDVSKKQALNVARANLAVNRLSTEPPEGGAAYTPGKPGGEAKTYYIAEWEGPGGRRETKTFLDRKEAETFIARFKGPTNIKTESGAGARRIPTIDPTDTPEIRMLKLAGGGRFDQRDLQKFVDESEAIMAQIDTVIASTRDLYKGKVTTTEGGEKLLNAGAVSALGVLRGAVGGTLGFVSPTAYVTTAKLLNPLDGSERAKLLKYMSENKFDFVMELGGSLLAGHIVGGKISRELTPITGDAKTILTKAYKTATKLSNDVLKLDPRLQVFVRGKTLSKLLPAADEVDAVYGSDLTSRLLAKGLSPDEVSDMARRYGAAVDKLSVSVDATTPLSRDISQWFLREGLDLDDTIAMAERYGKAVDKIANPVIRRDVVQWFIRNSVEVDDAVKYAADFAEKNIKTTADLATELNKIKPGSFTQQANIVGDDLINYAAKFSPDPKVATVAKLDWLNTIDQKTFNQIVGSAEFRKALKIGDVPDTAKLASGLLLELDKLGIDEATANQLLLDVAKNGVKSAVATAGSLGLSAEAQARIASYGISMGATDAGTPELEKIITRPQLLSIIEKPDVVSINKLSREDLTIILPFLRFDELSRVLPSLKPEQIETIIQELSDAQLAEVFNDMTPTQIEQTIQGIDEVTLQRLDMVPEVVQITKKRRVSAEDDEVMDRAEGKRKPWRPLRFRVVYGGKTSIRKAGSFHEALSQAMAETPGRFGYADVLRLP